MPRLARIAVVQQHAFGREPGPQVVGYKLPSLIATDISCYSRALEQPLQGIVHMVWTYYQPCYRGDSEPKNVIFLSRWCVRRRPWESMENPKSPRILNQPNAPPPPPPPEGGGV